MPINQLINIGSRPLIYQIGHANIPSMLEKLTPSTTVVDQCTMALQRAILSGQISPGDRLPTERDLAVRFGVNRVSVRTALARLSASGLVSVRQGSGYRVLDYQEVGGTELIVPLLELAAQTGRLREAIADLLLNRRIATIGVLSQLSAGSQRSDRLPIHDAIGTFEAFIQEQAAPLLIANAESQIYIGLVKATHRPMLGLGLHPVNRALVQHPQVIRALVKQPSENLMVWRLIEAWLERPTSSQLPSWLNNSNGDEQTLRRMGVDR